MPIMVNLQRDLVIPVPMAPAQRKRLDELTVKTDRTSVESAELSALQASVNGRQVTLLAGMQEVDDEVARHPLVAKFRASDKQVSAHKRIEELEVELAVMTAERDQERRKAMGALSDANVEAAGDFELTEEQVLRLDHLHARMDSLNAAEAAEFNFLRQHRLPEPNPQVAAPASEGATRAQAASGPRTHGAEPDSTRQPPGRPPETTQRR